jgi:hypothetical protein
MKKQSMIDRLALATIFAVGISAAWFLLSICLLEVVLPRDILQVQKSSLAGALINGCRLPAPAIYAFTQFVIRPL